MPTPAEIINGVAALQNDSAQEKYTDDACLPYLNLTLDELQEVFEQNNIPVTNETSAVINVAASVTPGITTIGFSTGLPSNLIEIQKVWERLFNTNPFVPMSKVEFLSPPDQLVSSFQVWAWIDNEIHVVSSLQNNELKLDYIKSIFATPLTIASIDTDLGAQFKNIKTYLEYKTAALCSMYIGENETRAAALNSQAEDALSRSLGISVKGKQAITTRRRPFRAAYKRNAW